MMIKFNGFSPPEQKSPYIIADYIELLCLINIDKEIDLKTAISRIYHNDKTDEIFDDVELYDGRKITNIGEIKDRHEEKAGEWFEHLGSRQNIYGDFYPFSVDGRIVRCGESLTAKNKLYIFFLLCSSLRILQKSSNYRNTITTDFEIISQKALEKYLPEFTVNRFGKGTSQSSIYPTKLVDKIKLLAKQLNEKCLPDVEESIGKQNPGDGGLDLVAFRKPSENDMVPGLITCFAQCACSISEWKKKTMEAHPDKWRTRITFIAPPSNMVFIPFSFRRVDGMWYEKDKVSGCILMDRYRLCFLLDDFKTDILASNTIINALTEYLEQP